MLILDGDRRRNTEVAKEAKGGKEVKIEPEVSGNEDVAPAESEVIVNA